MKKSAKILIFLSLFLKGFVYRMVVLTGTGGISSSWRNMQRTVERKQRHRVGHRMSWCWASSDPAEARRRSTINCILHGSRVCCWQPGGRRLTEGALLTFHTFLCMSERKVRQPRPSVSNYPPPAYFLQRARRQFQQWIVLNFIMLPWNSCIDPRAYYEGNVF